MPNFSNASKFLSANEDPFRKRSHAALFHPDDLPRQRRKLVDCDGALYAAPSALLMDASCNRGTNLSIQGQTPNSDNCFATNSTDSTWQHRDYDTLSGQQQHQPNEYPTPSSTYSVVRPSFTSKRGIHPEIESPFYVSPQFLLE